MSKRSPPCAVAIAPSSHEQENVSQGHDLINLRLFLCAVFNPAPWKRRTCIIVHVLYTTMCCIVEASASWIHPVKALVSSWLFHDG